ncbi:glycoside hydrolase family 12 protein [Daedalea quercina L-15889]|uniref:Glycoside hydrolase family 12 protein n=1 Tax=Daedalea quercina L-15889 TaxID=1314783 RepID=A0A165LNB3_9APHY|nr:glycoside hydrolase family 12 protein [Daedalea quercina L-15889]
MPSFALVLLPLLGAALVLSEPVPRTTQIDTSSYCGQYDTVTAGSYVLNLDQWGISGATGSDCANLVSLSGSTIAWQTEWSWSGGSGVKTFTNIQLTDGINVQLSDINSIQSSWSWSQSGSGAAVSDVAYDLFTSSTSGGSSENDWEIMVWLANYNSGPISYNYDSSGNAVPIESGLSIAGNAWDLYYGSNGYNYVYSFLPSSNITSFSGDVNLFLQYLTSEQSLPSSQYLTTFEAGTEATSGSDVTFNTAAYSAIISS